MTGWRDGGLAGVECGQFLQPHFHPPPLDLLGIRPFRVVFIFSLQSGRILTLLPEFSFGRTNTSEERARVHLEFVVTIVSPLPSAGAFTSPPEGRRPTSMTNSRCTQRASRVRNLVRSAPFSCML